ncbi:MULTISPECIES: alpha/beta fold hydrolase [Gordonia]|uniref:alpha/beta fold hydrolase n=1 Tax=Gordonia TaxID=2053 RepID=UPI00041C2E59|nr:MULTISPECIES: alpha/beta hydrolase [Gordonia]KAF0969968.1 2-succinyl-6-hydroxy-2,4-cyclohexadiene-1-carboxylate synthase [Gordonia sp. YY1]
MNTHRTAAARRAGVAGAVGLGVTAAAVAGYVTRNLTYDRRESALLASSGVIPRSVTMPGGAVISYGEGPPGGEPLLLIPGQQVSWSDYAAVLGALSEDWHVFAVDCFGHGGSAKDPAWYPALRQTAALGWFVDTVIGSSAVVAGHSSGGLLAARLAADCPALVRAVLIEDAPFFATEPDRAPATFAWRDGFRPMHDFLTAPREAEMTWTRHWVRHSHLRALFGDKGWTRLVRDPVERRLDRDPRRIPRLWWLPPTMNRALDLTACLQDGTGDYDLCYGEMFYDGTWFEGFDQAETLARVRVPVTLLHATVHEQDGVLLGAMTDDDARRAHVLMRDCLLVDHIPAGHDIHRQRPALFVDSINALPGRIHR